jgi:tetratricopeptide (TPR) repeat protein
MPKARKVYGDRNYMTKAGSVLEKGLNCDMLARKTNTYCHLMWERTFINEYGDIFFCCLCRPEPIGNIYEHDLAYIWQESEKAKLFREMALRGDLGCYASCTVLSKREKEIALGRFYRNRGKLIEAEAAFKEALKISPKNHNIYFELGWLYKDQGKYAEAKASFKKALELEPRNPDAYVGLGWFRKEEKRYAEAGELFEKALKLNPASFAAYAELGWLYKDQGKYAEAEAFFKKALELNTNTENSYVGLGWLYKDQGRLDQARQLLKKATEINPANEVAQALFAQINHKQDRIDMIESRSVKGELVFKKNLDTIPQNDKSDLDLYKQDNTDYPRTLHILIGTLCPISCIMCRQNHRLNIALNNDMLKRNIDWPRINDITIQGGEVLAIPSAKELLIWLIEKMQKKIKLVTNGLLINHEWAERLVRGSEWIEISVNAATKQMHELVNRGSDFNRVIRNIKMLIELKRNYNIKTDIRFHFTIVPENVQEIAKAIKFADQLGCDLIAYSFDSPKVEISLSQHKKIKEKIKNELSRLNNENLKIKIQRNQLEQLGLLDSFNHKLVVDDY